MAVVLEKQIAAAHCRDEQIGVSVVIDVRKSSRDADAARHAYACFRRNVPELAATQVLPKLVPAGLAYEIDVVQSIAVHIRDGDSVSVVIMSFLIVACRIVDDVIHEGDSALRKPVLKLKLIKHLELIDGL